MLLMAMDMRTCLRYGEVHSTNAEAGEMRSTNMPILNYGAGVVLYRNANNALGLATYIPALPFTVPI